MGLARGAAGSGVAPSAGRAFHGGSTGASVLVWIGGGSAQRLCHGERRGS